MESPILKDYYNALSSLDSRSYVVESSILQNYYNFVFVELLWKVLFERLLQQTMLKFGDRSCGKPRFGELLQQKILSLRQVSCLKNGSFLIEPLNTFSFLLVVSKRSIFALSKHGTTPLMTIQGLVET